MRDAGAQPAGYVLLWLPHEVSPLFRDWLQTHVSDRAAHVMSTISQLRGGKDYDASFGLRMRAGTAFPACEKAVRVRRPALEAAGERTVQAAA